MSGVAVMKTKRTSLPLAALVCSLACSLAFGLSACGSATEGEDDPVVPPEPDPPVEEVEPKEMEEPVALGIFAAATPFRLLPPSGGEAEIISGFQGGVHLEPGLRFDADDYTAAELSGSVTLRVRRLSDDQVISEGAIYPFEPYSFVESDGAWLYRAPPVIFAGASSSDGLRGEQVRIEADVVLASEAGGRALSAEVELVDEVDEL